MALLYLSEENLKTLLNKVCDWGETFWVNANADGKPKLEKASKQAVEDYQLPQCRGKDPLKQIIFPPRQRVAEYPNTPQKRFEVQPKKRAIVGLTACDLSAIRIYDRVYLEDEEFVDPFYKANRENLFLISIDCSEVYKTCFCNLVNGKPYPEKGFDINLTPVEDGYLMDVATDPAQEMIKGIGASDASDTLKKRRDQIRTKSQNKLEEQNKAFETSSDYQKLVTKADGGHKSYEHHASTCVMCGACTHVCPGCFCFGLMDNKVDGKYERMISWDSCHYSGFSRMAGMGNPRGRAVQRFQHRYNHKFYHYPERYAGAYSCVGCGRCVDNCMGKIDMRATLRDLSVENVSEMYPSPSPAPDKDPRGDK